MNRSYLSEVIAEIRDAETRAGEIGMRGAKTLYRRWAAGLAKYEPLVEAAEAYDRADSLHHTHPLTLEDRKQSVLREALALFAPTPEVKP